MTSFQSHLGHEYWATSNGKLGWVRSAIAYYQLARITALDRHWVGIFK
ncbi:hypothetical protein [Allocoleopsis sp.]